jgi:hypothetical protein
MLRKVKFELSNFMKSRLSSFEVEFSFEGKVIQVVADF